MPYANNQGVHIYYEQEGDGPPLVLQHELGDSLKGWRDYGYVATLKQTFRLILIDARGHGYSDKPHDPRAYTLERRVSDVVAVLACLALSQVHYLGNAMGGWIGFGLARYAPERLHSLTLLNAHPYAESLAPLRNVLASGLQAWVSGVESETGSLPFLTRQRLLDNDVHALLAAVAEDRTAIFESLSGLTLPCRLLAGPTDRCYRLAQRAAGEMPNAHFIRLDGLSRSQAYAHKDLVLPHLMALLPSGVG